MWNFHNPKSINTIKILIGAFFDNKGKHSSDQQFYTIIVGNFAHYRIAAQLGSDIRPCPDNTAIFTAPIIEILFSDYIMILFDFCKPRIIIVI